MGGALDAELAVEVQGLEKMTLNGKYLTFQGGVVDGMASLGLRKYNKLSTIQVVPCSADM